MPFINGLQLNHYRTQERKEIITKASSLATKGKSSADYAKKIIHEMQNIEGKMSNRFWDSVIAEKS